MLVALVAIAAALTLAGAATAATVVVKPTARLNVTADGVTVSGARGALSPDARVTVTPLTVSRNLRDPTAFGVRGTFVVGGRGVQVSLRRGHIRKPLAITLPVPRTLRGASRISFRRADGRWRSVPARRVAPGRIRAIVTPAQLGLPTRRGAGAAEQQFGGIQLSFLGLVDNIGGWLSSAFDAVVRDWGARRTEPLRCGERPSWIDDNGGPDHVHTCLINNPDPGSGRERAELQIKSNRGYTLWVAIPDGVEYVWVSNQDDALRRTLGSAMGFDSNRFVLLTPGEWMTMGFSRTDRSVQVSATTSWQSSFFTITEAALSLISERSSALTAAAVAAGWGCVNKAGNVNAGALLAAVPCVVGEAFTIAADPQYVPLQKDKFGTVRRFVTRSVAVAKLVPAVGAALTNVLDAIYSRPIGLAIRGQRATAPDPVPQQPTQPTTPTQPSTPAQPQQPALSVSLVVFNKVTNGPTAMREDSAFPVYLGTAPRNFCKRDGCAIPGTDRQSGGTFAPAVCQAQGARTTNGHDADPGDDFNPGLFTSTRWYGVRQPDGGLGYVSEVWISPGQRGGLGLPTC